MCGWGAQTRGVSAQRHRHCVLDDINGSIVIAITNHSPHAQAAMSDGITRAVVVNHNVLELHIGSRSRRARNYLLTAASLPRLDCCHCYQSRIHCLFYCR